MMPNLRVLDCRTVVYTVNWSGLEMHPLQRLVLWNYEALQHNIILPNTCTVVDFEGFQTWYKTHTNQVVTFFRDMLKNVHPNTMFMWRALRYDPTHQLLLDAIKQQQIVHWANEEDFDSAYAITAHPSWKPQAQQLVMHC